MKSEMQPTQQNDFFSSASLPKLQCNISQIIFKKKKKRMKINEIAYMDTTINRYHLKVSIIKRQKKNENIKQIIIMQL
jgi:hypothetical protein